MCPPGRDRWVYRDEREAARDVTWVLLEGR